MKKFVMLMAVLLIAGCSSKPDKVHRYVMGCSESPGGLFTKNSGYAGYMVQEWQDGRTLRITRCIPCDLAKEEDELFVCFGRKTK